MPQVGCARTGLYSMHGRLTNPGPMDLLSGRGLLLPKSICLALLRFSVDTREEEEVEITRERNANGHTHTWQGLNHPSLTTKMTSVFRQSHRRDRAARRECSRAQGTPGLNSLCREMGDTRPRLGDTAEDVNARATEEFI